VPKQNGTLRRIQHLSYPAGRSVNDFIPSDYGTITYTRLDEILRQIIVAGRGALLFKRDIQHAFRNIPVAMHQRWLLGLKWGICYTENCLPFGLRTAPALFNLFAEGLHWIAQHELGWTLSHFLDDFIAILPPPRLHLVPHVLRVATDNWIAITDSLGIPRASAKDEQGTTVTALGIEIDTLAMEARLPQSKLDKSLKVISALLSSQSVSRKDIERVTGLLSFCSQAVTIGRTHIRRLWDFLHVFNKNTRRRCLSPGARADFTWWQDLLPRYNGVRFFHDNQEEINLWTDAFQAGYWWLLAINISRATRHRPGVLPASLIIPQDEPHQCA
jgi:hypothetical protein